MKRHGKLFIALIFLAGISCQEKVDVKKEQEAIKAALEKSSQAWLDRNYEEMESSWSNDGLVVRLNAGKFNYGMSEGWDNQSTRYKNAFKNSPEPLTNKEIATNHRFRIYPNSALVLYDVELRNENDEHLSDRIYTAFLEKENGQWKLAYLSTVQKSSYETANKNIATSATYHKLNPDDIEAILTDDFIGRTEKSKNTWSKEDHHNFWTANKDAAQDSIYGQLGQGNWVATMFLRKMNYNGRDVEAEAMQFKRFEDGKIAEIFEFGDPSQWN